LRNWGKTPGAQMQQSPNSIIPGRAKRESRIRRAALTRIPGLHRMRTDQK